jgi:hypothetical protein
MPEVLEPNLVSAPLFLWRQSGMRAFLQTPALQRKTPAAGIIPQVLLSDGMDDF